MARRLIGGRRRLEKRLETVRFGNPSAPILVICDTPPPKVWHSGKPMSMPQMELFAKAAKEAGLKKDDFNFICPSPPIPFDRMDSMKQKNDWLKMYEEEFRQMLERYDPKAVVLVGNLAYKQYVGRATKITKSRGLPLEVNDMPCLPILSTGYVAKFSEYYPIFKADMDTLKRLKDADYDVHKAGSLNEEVAENYKYTLDLQEVIDAKPKIMAVDTETTGLMWHKEEVFPFLVQLTYKEGHSLLVPLVERYVPEGLNPADIPKAKQQLKQILEDASIHKVGHNLKYDDHMLRKLDIEVKGWRHDTMQMAYAYDENLRDYSLTNCIRMFVPEMAGYDDELSRNYDKSAMIDVPPEIMKQYAGGDTDATFRLCKALLPKIRQDAKHYKRYTHVVMPSLLMFSKVAEPTGVGIDLESLATLQETLREEENRQRTELLETAPVAVKRRAINEKWANGVVDKLVSSPKFVRACLFSGEGFNLTPRVFTKATNEPSTSAQNHLIYFEDHEWVAKYMEHVKLKKMTSTYVNNFERYITDGRIHPSFHLHRTNTGRVASSDPNGQNIPKRGTLAKTYRKMFIPREGFVIVEADYSQAELKIAACMANDTAMIKAYQEQGDLHTLTAAQTMGLTLEQFRALPPEVQGQKRFEAKAVNFGFIYGMSANGFKTYAKTQYGIDYTDQQANQFRNTFFRSYSRLIPWHRAMIKEARADEMVRSMHGVKRLLPSINSKDNGVRSLSERQAINAPVQLFASDLNLIAANRFMRDAPLDEVRTILTVHDAVILEVKQEKAEEHAAALKWYMENNPLKEWFDLELPISLDAEVAIGDTYGTTEEDPYKNMQSLCPDYYNAGIDAKAPMPSMTELSVYKLLDT